MENPYSPHVMGPPVPLGASNCLVVKLHHSHEGVHLQAMFSPVAHPTTHSLAINPLWFFPLRYWQWLTAVLTMEYS